MAKRLEYTSVSASFKRKYVPETEHDTEKCILQQEPRHRDNVDELSVKRQSPDILEDSERPQSPSILHPKVEKHLEKRKQRPECSHCIAIQRDEKDQRNDMFCLLIKEEMKNIEPCMRTRVYSRILVFLHSLEGKHSNDVPLTDSELQD